MSFETVVAQIPEIHSCFKAGLKALGAHSTLVTVRETRVLEGSVNLDECLAASRPSENRWDYFFAYKGEVFYLEVHPASTSEVSTIINKLNWLRSWLLNHAPALNALSAKTIFPFHWIHTGRSHILPTSKQYRLAAENNILPKARLHLNH